MSAIVAKLAQVQHAIAAGRLEQAKSLCTRLTQTHGSDPGVNAMQSVVLSRLGLFEQAAYFAKRACELLPNEAELRVRLGQVLSMAGKLGEALPHLEEGLHRMPKSTDARGSLVAALVGLNRIVDAIDVGKAGLPTSDPNLVSFVANALLSAGRVEECVTLYRAAAKEHPRNTNVLSNLANALNYMPGVSTAEVLAAHVAFGIALVESTPPLPRIESSGIGTRPLRVGIMSPDLRRHSVAYFMEPLLIHHDRTAIEIYVYSTSRVQDDMTHRLRPFAKVWRDEEAASDLALAQRVRQDKVDVLVELSGHTVGARLPVMALRPAPVQVTYLGYPNTTGLACIDARIVDSTTDPEPSSDALATERLARLDPCFVCFAPPANAPDLTPVPSARGEAITFGSFNTAQKLNAELITLWARVLQRVQGSRLLLKATNFADERLRHDVAARFAAAGLEPGRVEVAGPMGSTTDHLSAYSRIDVALDPYPYHGTTTTCEALWMGVPVVSLIGHAHASRVGASLLAQVGLTDLAASSSEDYVEIAAGLGSDRPRLSELRSSLRGRMRSSPLCDGPSFARRMQSCLESLVKSTRQSV